MREGLALNSLKKDEGRKMTKNDPLISRGLSLTSSDRARYERQIIIPELGIQGQERISQSRILCIGAGGLGSPVLLYLAAAGVGTLGILDFDVVDESNLQRQVIHGQSDLGTLKTQSARQRILEINPSITVITHDFRIDRSNAIEVISQYDIVIDATDNFATRYLINDACVLLNKPCIWGSVLRFDGQASVFWADRGPCYRCLHTSPPPAESVLNCAQAGVLGMLCATIGSIQATEAIKIITGIGTTLIGHVLIYDALEMRFDKIALAKDPACALCGPSPTQTVLLDDYEVFCATATSDKFSDNRMVEISPQELSVMMGNSAKFQLIDVREPNEWAESKIEGAVLIPQGEFLDGRAIAKIDADLPIVLYCRSGGRSAHCLNLLIEQGINNAVHLEGGILAWHRYSTSLR